MIFYKGKFLSDEDFHIGPLNRALFFGENPFTSGVIFNKKVLGVEQHLDRLKKMTQFFYHQEFDSFEKEIRKALTDFDSSEPHYFRITFFENSDYFIFFKPHAFEEVELHAKLSSYPRGRSSLPSFVKLGNYTENFNELKEVKKDGFNEIVLIDFEGKILECTTSNLLFVREGVVHTPLIREGILNGVTRSRLIRYLEEKSIPFVEDNFDHTLLESADEIWCTNAVKGLRPFSTFNQRNLKRDLFEKIQAEFCEYE